MNDTLQNLMEKKQSPGILWLKAHALVTFFILTFFITFVSWVPVFLSLPGSGISSVIGMWGPAISAILITALTLGKPGLKDLLHRVLLWRVAGRWYLIILFGWAVIAIAAALLHAQMTNQPIIIHWERWTGVSAWLIQAPLLGFWACEEIGWRGFALPRLLNRWNAFISSIILGGLWALWHLPYYVGSNGFNPDFVGFIIFTISLSILMTWVFNHTRGSVFVATFFHFWINIYSVFQSDKLALLEPGGETTVQAWLLAAAALLVVYLLGFRTLTGGRFKNASIDLNEFKIPNE